MEKLDGSKEREAIRTAEKSECIGKAAPLSAGGTTAAKTFSEEKSCGQRTIRKVEKTMKKTILNGWAAFLRIGGCRLELSKSCVGD